MGNCPSDGLSKLINEGENYKFFLMIFFCWFLIKFR